MGNAKVQFAKILEKRKIFQLFKDGIGHCEKKMFLCLPLTTPPPPALLFQDAENRPLRFDRSDRATWPEACLSRCVSQIGLGVEDDIMLAGWMVYIFEDDI